MSDPCLISFSEEFSRGAPAAGLAVVGSVTRSEETSTFLFSGLVWFCALSASRVPVMVSESG